MQRYNFTNPLFLFKIESMMRRIYIVLSLLLLTACDDGDIITVDLEFDKELDYCTNSTESFLIYDLREDPNESLSLIIPRNNDQEFPFTEATPVDDPIEFEINMSTIRFIYRTYNRSVGTDELCDLVPPADLTIVEDYEADSGTAFVTVTIDDDDNDGIPSEDEYGPGGLADPQDTDGDGIADYLDEDDDNDNVKTINELDTENADGDDNPATNPLDTDNDGTADYLDTDDDGDGVLTRFEDEDLDKNPINDTSITEGVSIAHYLNELEATDYGDPGLTDDNEYSRTVTASFLITGFDFDILSADELDLGTLTYSFPLQEED